MPAPALRDRIVLRDGTDVTDHDIRQLLARCLDWQLEFDVRFGKALAEIGNLAKRVNAVEVEQERADEQRESSYHDFAEELERAKKLLVARVKDPKDEMTSERARAIAAEAVVAAKVAEKAQAFDELQRQADQARRERRKLLLSIIGAVVAGLTLGALAMRFGLPVVR